MSLRLKNTLFSGRSIIY